jgi:hypothetical protein
MSHLDWLKLKIATKLQYITFGSIYLFNDRYVLNSGNHIIFRDHQRLYLAISELQGSKCRHNSSVDD